MPNGTVAAILDSAITFDMGDGTVSGVGDSLGVCRNC